MHSTYPLLWFPSSSHYMTSHWFFIHVNSFFLSLALVRCIYVQHVDFISYVDVIIIGVRVSQRDLNYARIPIYRAERKIRIIFSLSCFRKIWIILFLDVNFISADSWSSSISRMKQVIHHLFNGMTGDGTAARILSLFLAVDLFISFKHTDQIQSNSSSSVVLRHTHTAMVNAIN